jgi:1-acyl-sn-glycerol-3-phosphate acyltransferase
VLSALVGLLIQKMKFIKDILARIFALWGMIVFITTMLLLYIPFLLTGLYDEPKRTIHFYNLSRIWMNIFFFFTFVRRKFKGKEHFKNGENYVVVCNHNTFMDVPLSSPGIPGANKTIAKAELTKIPLFGIIYKRGSVLVDRKSEESRKASFGKMKQTLAMGLHMCIYPEGTRNKTSEPLQRFHDGAFRLAIETGNAIVPTLIFYTKIVMPRRFFYFWPHRVEMHFLPPVSVDGHSVASLRDKIFQQMQEYYVANNGRPERRSS